MRNALRFIVSFIMYSAVLAPMVLPAIVREFTSNKLIIFVSIPISIFYIYLYLTKLHEKLNGVLSKSVFFRWMMHDCASFSFVREQIARENEEFIFTPLNRNGKIIIKNFISIFLLAYYIGGFFVFVFYNSYRIVQREPSQEQLYFSSLGKKDEAPGLFSFLNEVNESSIEECRRLNRKYGTSFVCDTTPYSGLRVPYDKLPLDEKIEARLADFFKALAGLFGRDFRPFMGMHIFLAFFALAPLAVLAGPPLLWRLLCRAWGRKQVMAERPIYRGVVGAFALAMLVLVAAVVGVAMMDRSEGEKGALSEAAIEAHDEMVRNLLN